MAVKVGEIYPLIDDKIKHLMRKQAKKEILPSLTDQLRQQLFKQVEAEHREVTQNEIE